MHLKIKRLDVFDCKKQLKEFCYKPNVMLTGCGDFEIANSFSYPDLQLLLLSIKSFTSSFHNIRRGCLSVVAAQLLDVI